MKEDGRIDGTEGTWMDLKQTKEEKAGPYLPQPPRVRCEVR